ncbi:hypothetical protein RIF29_05235 [Crotalaria pallida]|uniref:Phytocyanin domain-containing protein n=1 Tax=Crotalaria pallida TaxID=3830 RepID=A0AAN9PAU4_CROPI
MTLNRTLILVALLATFFSNMAVEAKEFIVGDENGWTTWLDYSEWAANKLFRVGDTLSKLTSLSSLNSYYSHALVMFKFDENTLNNKWLRHSEFEYTPGKDNVIRVNESDFINCSVPPNAQPLSSGHDIILLTSPGTKFYISGVANHCKIFQKLVITVLPPEGSWRSPAPSSVPGVPEVPSVPRVPSHAPAPSAPCIIAPAPRAQYIAPAKCLEEAISSLVIDHNLPI